MINYKKAGVDIAAGNRLVERIKKFAPKIGGFSDGMALPKGVKDPVLVGCADGVGTKLAIAQALNIHHTVGYDLVGMNVNDLICSGAKPLFFLDYFATGKLEVGVAEKVVKGIAKACREADCPLLGGETAEMPGFYKPGEYDLAGFATGVVSKKSKLTPKETLRAGDVLLGLRSSGLHSNGYSLVRKVFKKSEWRRKAKDLLSPTRLYVRDIVRLIDKVNGKGSPGVKGVVHVTGGGFTENIPRILPHGLRAKIFLGSWTIPSIFKEIQKRGRVTDAEMFKTFNMGIGMIVAVAPHKLNQAKRILKKAVLLGMVEQGHREVIYVSG
jgi:phosphoribosylformylglycinamidine cyclo-ligase